MTRRLTSNDELVLEAIGDAGVRHATAADIYDRLRRVHPHLGFATVHRALNRLVELHLAIRLNVPERDAAIYEAMTHAHAHFSCRQCGAVADVAYEIEPRVREAVAAAIGARVDQDIVHFRGVCAACIAVAQVPA